MTEGGRGGKNCGMRSPCLFSASQLGVKFAARAAMDIYKLDADKLARGLAQRVIEKGVTDEHMWTCVRFSQRFRLDIASYEKFISGWLRPERSQMTRSLHSWRSLHVKPGWPF